MRYALVLIAACGGVPNLPETSPEQPRGRPRFHAAAPSTCVAQPPLGDPSQLTVRELPGFTIADPKVCGSQAYIRIERLAGSRKLGIGRVKGGGFGEGCTDPTTFATCSILNVGAVLMLVRNELALEHFDTADIGGGPCGNYNADYEGWNFAIGVHDWKNADRLITKVAEVFDRFDLKGYVGVSLYTIGCVELL